MFLVIINLSFFYPICFNLFKIYGDSGIPFLHSKSTCFFEYKNHEDVSICQRVLFMFTKSLKNFGILLSNQDKKKIKKEEACC